MQRAKKNISQKKNREIEMGKFANCNTTAHLNNKYKLHFDEKKLDLLFLIVFCSSLFSVVDALNVKRE